MNINSNLKCEKTFLIFQANSEASLGKYVAGSVEGKAGDTGLFVKNHAY